MLETLAARIDGANNWQVFAHIVAPAMRGIMTLVLILGAIGNLQHFDLPWTMVQGGPARATTTLSIEVYKTAFKNWNMGKAATVGTIWRCFWPSSALSTCARSTKATERRRRGCFKKPWASACFSTRRRC